MQRSRRAVLAAIPVALAGCGRSLRDNAVPGGLHIRNRRTETISVAVRAAQLPELQENEGGGAGVTESPTETPATPRDEQLDPPDVTGEYEVEPDEEHAVPDFFPRPGRWAVEAVLNPESENDGDRTRIVLHAALPGPAGADSVVIRVTDDGLTAEATEVD